MIQVEYDIAITFKLLLALKLARVIRIVLRPLTLLIIGAVVAFAAYQLGYYVLIAIALYLLVFFVMLFGMLAYSIRQMRLVHGRKTVIQHQSVTKDKIVVSVPGRVEITIPRDKVKDIRYGKRVVSFRYVRYITCLPLPDTDVPQTISALQQLGWK